MAKEQYLKPLAEIVRPEGEAETREECLAKVGEKFDELQKDLDAAKGREESADTLAAFNDLKAIWTEYGLPENPNTSDIALMSYAAQAAYYAKITAAKAKDITRKALTASKYKALQIAHDSGRKIAEALCKGLAPAENPKTPAVPEP